MIIRYSVGNVSVRGGILRWLPLEAVNEFAVQELPQHQNTLGARYV